MCQFPCVRKLQTSTANTDKLHKTLRPCVRQKFLNFSFSWVLEMFGFWSSEFFPKNPNFSNSQKFLENSSDISSDIISCFWVKKNPVFGWNSLEKVRKPLFWIQKQGFPNIQNLRKIQNFQKLLKNDVKIEFRKSRKTRSDSKTDSNVWFKVRNAGPYKTLSWEKSWS